MLFGGNAEGGPATNTIDILDLVTFIWSSFPELPNAPPARNSHSACCGVVLRALAADRHFREGLSHDEPEDDESEEAQEAWVNVGGRLMPMQMFAQLLRLQVGDEESTRMLQQFLAMETEGDGEEGEEQDGEDGEEPDIDGGEED